MGTRGYWAYRSGGWYFVHYNHWDSYPSGLGRNVAGYIPQKDKFEAWKQAKQAQLAEDLQAWLQAHKDSEDEGQGKYFVSKSPPENDLFIEWVYTIDLDRNLFSVDNGAHFVLDDLPSDWPALLDLDENDVRCLSIHTPAPSRGIISPPVPEVLAARLMEYDDLSPSYLEIAAPTQKDLIGALNDLYMKAFLRLNSISQVAGASFDDDPGFNIVNARVTGTIDLLFRLFRGSFETCFKEINNHRRDVVEYIGCVGETFYLLSPHLDVEDVLKSAVVDAVEYMSENKSEIWDDTSASVRLKCIICSVLHVAIVELTISPDDSLSVTHTAAVPLITDVTTRSFSLEGAALLRYAFHVSRITLDPGLPPVHGSKIESLPVEILRSILVRVEEKTLRCACTLVSKAWRAVTLSLLDRPRLRSIHVLNLLGKHADGRVVAFSCIDDSCDPDDSDVLLVVPSHSTHTIWNTQDITSETPQFLIAIAAPSSSTSTRGRGPLKAFLLTKVQYANPKILKMLDDCALPFELKDVPKCEED